MAEWAKQALQGPIHLADAVTKACAQSDRPEFQQELKPRSEKLAVLLRQAARFADLYERPARRILLETQNTLEKALAHVNKMSHQSFLTRLLAMTPAGALKKLSSLLDNSVSDVSWLLRISNPDADDLAGYGLPPIAANEPFLGLIWEQVARLNSAPLDQRADAAAALASLAENERYRNLIIQEGGVPPLHRLLKEGGAQENAVKAIGLLAGDQESVEQMVQSGACSALTAVLKDGPSMTVQAAVAGTIADFADHSPKSQDVFFQQSAVRLLVVHLAYETVEEHSKYTVVPRASMHSVVQSTISASKSSTSASSSGSTPAPVAAAVATHHHHLNQQVRKMADPETKAHMKAMAARALGSLCRDNPAICRNVTESRALLCFAVLLEKGGEVVRRNSALALMEIARVAERDPDLRHAAFKPTSPAARAVVDQLLKVVEKGVYGDLLVPCIVALGCLSKTFRASETRIIPPLVKLLDQRELEVMKEAALALTKFACTDNFLSESHSRAIIDAGGARHLIQLVYFEEEVKIPALLLLCYIAKAVPDSDELAEGNVLNVLEWASKQSNLMQDETLDVLLPETRGALELYQSRGSNLGGAGGMAAAPGGYPL